MSKEKTSTGMLYFISSILFVLGFAISFVLLASSTEANQDGSINETEVDSVEINDPYMKEAFDGTEVLVIPDKEGFTFYRDRNNDGLADSKGRGAFLAFDSGLSRIFKEEDLIYKIEMSKLKEKYIDKNQ